MSNPGANIGGVGASLKDTKNTTGTLHRTRMVMERNLNRMDTAMRQLSHDGELIKDSLDEHAVELKGALRSTKQNLNTVKRAEVWERYSLRAALAFFFTVTFYIICKRTRVLSLCVFALNKFIFHSPAAFPPLPERFEEDSGLRHGQDNNIINSLQSMYSLEDSKSASELSSHGTVAVEGREDSDSNSDSFTHSDLSLCNSYGDGDDDGDGDRTSSSSSSSCRNEEVFDERPGGLPDRASASATGSAAPSDSDSGSGPGSDSFAIATASVVDTDTKCDTDSQTAFDNDDTYEASSGTDSTDEADGVPDYDIHVDTVVDMVMENIAADYVADDLVDDVIADNMIADDVTADDVTADDVTADDVTADDVTADDVIADDVIDDDVVAEETETLSTSLTDPVTDTALNESVDTATSTSTIIDTPHDTRDAGDDDIDNIDDTDDTDDIVTDTDDTEDIEDKDTEDSGDTDMGPDASLPGNDEL